MTEATKLSKIRLSKIRWNAQSEDGQVMLSLPWGIFVLGLAIISIVNLALAFIVRDPHLNQVIPSWTASSSSCSWGICCVGCRWPTTTAATS